MSAQTLSLFLLFSACLWSGSPTAFAAEEINTLPAPFVEPIATVRWLNGSPAILKTNRWLSLQIGDVIPAGATVRTSAGEMLEVVLDEPGHIISIGPESSASIDLRTASVNLETGELIASIRRTRKENTSVIVRSRFGESTIRAADMRVTVTPSPTLAVLSGSVQFTAARGGGMVMLAEGSFVVATAERPALERINPTLRGFLLGRVDAMVSFHGPLAEKFSPSANWHLCHVPPRPAQVDPAPRPARGDRRGSYADDDPQIIEAAGLAGDLSVQTNPGSESCPIHNRAPKTLAPRVRPQPIPPPVRRTARATNELKEIPASTVPESAAP